MLQNPRHYPWCNAPDQVESSPWGASCLRRSGGHQEGDVALRPSDAHSGPLILLSRITLPPAC